MRLFSVSTPKSSPELVRHSLVSRQSAALASGEAESHHSMPDRPAGNSPALVRGVSTLGRKVSRRFEKFGESETARRLRMASPSRKYQWAIAGGDAASAPAASSEDVSSKSPKQKSRVSRVDSFRNFFSLVQPSSSASATNPSSASTLRTPRAVKRRSKNGGERRSARLQLVDAATCTTEEMSAARHNLSAPNSLSNGLNSRFGSSSAELAMIMAGGGGPGGDGFSELSECQSEADLRYYNYCTTEDEDDNSVASEGFLRSSLLRSNSKSAGNLRLAMLPENRTVCNFPDRSSAIQIKDYGMIDSNVASRKDGDAGSKNESGYSSSDNNSNGTSPNSSSRASPRASLDGEQEQPQQSPVPKEAKSPHSSLSIPPKKPARTSKLNASRSRSLEQAAVTATATAVTVAAKDYKMVRLAKRSLSDELGIIIAKKKLKEINTTGFQIVHIEPGGMVDRQVT